MTYSVTTSQSLCHSPVGSWTEWPWQQRGRWCMDLVTWISTYQGWLGSDHCCVPNLPVADINTVSLTWHSSLEWSISYLVAGELYWTSITEVAAFWSYCNRSLLWIWICFLCKYISAKTVTRNLQRIPVHYHDISHSMASNQGTYSIVKEVW